MKKTISQLAGPTGLVWRRGHPSSDPNVKIYFDFEDFPNKIKDHVTETFLAKAGSPIFRMTKDPLSSYSPVGIWYVSGSEHNYLADFTNLNIGASDHFVIEFSRASKSFFESGTLGSHFSLLAITTVTIGIQVYSSTSTNFVVYLQADDTTSVVAVWTISDWRDGDIHTFRIVGNRTTALVELFIDEVSQGTVDISALASKVWTCKGFRVNGQASGAASNQEGFFGVLRMSIGTDVLSNNIFV